VNPFAGLGWAARASVAVVALYVLVALTGPLWAPFDPVAIMSGMPFEPPSASHLLGTDNLGRDVFSRVVHGTRPVLLIGLSASGLAVLAGGALGIVLGTVGGWIDEVGMRAMDILMSIPPLIVALLAVAIVGNAPVLVVATVGLIYAPRVARIVRARTLAVVSEDFVNAARLRGEGAWSIALRELLPEVSGILMLEFAIRSGFAIVFVGTLGFLGFGAPPPAPEWGLMINEGRATLSASLWPVLAPALAMGALVVALNLLTDGLTRTVGRPAEAPTR
jgi:peptide/nickel transport system permease protein